jgi:hypothetical protein
MRPPPPPGYARGRRGRHRWGRVARPTSPRCGHAQLGSPHTAVRAPPRLPPPHAPTELPAARARRSPECHGCTQADSGYAGTTCLRRRYRHARHGAPRLTGWAGVHVGGGAVGGRVGHVSTTGHFALMPAYPSAVLSLLHTHGHAHGARTHAHGARTQFHSHSTPSLSTQVASKPDLHDGC